MLITEALARSGGTREDIRKERHQRMSRAAGEGLADIPERQGRTPLETVPQWWASGTAHSSGTSPRHIGEARGGPSVGPA